MIKKKFSLPIYGYNIWLVQTEKEDSPELISKTMFKLGLEKKDIEDIVNGFNINAINGGYTFHDEYIRKFICFFYPFNSEAKKVEVYTHEKRHVEDRMLEWLGIKDIEASGCLAGFLGVQFWEFFKSTKVKTVKKLKNYDNDSKQRKD